MSSTTEMMDIKDAKRLENRMLEEAMGNKKKKLSKLKWQLAIIFNITAAAVFYFIKLKGII